MDQRSSELRCRDYSLSNVLEANATNPLGKPCNPPILDSRQTHPVVLVMARHKSIGMSLIRKDIPALVVISGRPRGSQATLRM